jgi:hypothetical protein
MKLTKSQLKQIIKEELEEALNIGGGSFTMDDPRPEEAAFEKLRKVMGLVEKAMLYMTGDEEGGLNPVEVLDMVRTIVLENLEERENNPWAICTASVGREDKEKYEKCIKSVKKQNRSKE